MALSITYTAFGQNVSNVIVLEKKAKSSQNVLTKDMISQPNKVYVVEGDYDLNGQTITLPKNCYLRFDGGCLRNGRLLGDIMNEWARPEWFGAKADGSHDDTEAIQMAVDLGRNVLLTGRYCVSKPIIVKNQGVTLEKGAEIKAIGSNIDYVFKYFGSTQPVYLDGGGTIQCNGVCGGIYYDTPKTFRLQNIYINKMAHNPALTVKRGYMESYNVTCDGRGVAKAQQPLYNIQLDGGSDHKFDRWTIVTQTTGIKGCGGSAIFTRVHVWGGADCGFIVNGGCTFNMCYTDWCKVGFKILSGAKLCILNHNTIGNADETLIYSEVPVVKGILSFGNKLDKGIQLVRFSDMVNNGQCLLDVDNSTVASKKGYSNQRPVFSEKNKDAMSGFTFYDMTLKKMILFNGNAWVNMDGSKLN